MILLNSRSRTSQKEVALFRDVNDQFLQDVLQGLSKNPKELPCKYFYDERGSVLFTQICETAEYYITRTELQLLDQILPELAELIGEDASIVEYGSGEGKKIRNLLRALRNPSAYVPIDISAEILWQSSRRLKAEFPDLTVFPLVADYSAPISLPQAITQDRHGRRVVFFPGSTISNFRPAEARTFLNNLRSFLRDGDGFILGADLIKSPNRLHQAYNDYDGVTAEFNLNLLRRINRELHADFKIHKFEHYAFYNPILSRIEMHLVSLAKQNVTIASQRFSFAEGETIHTENSYKYSVEGIMRLGHESGFAHERVWTDRDKLFSVHYLSAA